MVVADLVHFYNLTQKPGLVGQALEQNQVVRDGKVLFVDVEGVVGLEEGDSALHQIDSPSPLDIVAGQVLPRADGHVVDPVVPVLFDAVTVASRESRQLLWLSALGDGFGFELGSLGVLGGQVIADFSVELGGSGRVEAQGNAAEDVVGELLLTEQGLPREDHGFAEELLVQMILFLGLALVIHEEPDGVVVSVVEGDLVGTHFILVNDMDVYAATCEHFLQGFIRSVYNRDYERSELFDGPRVEQALVLLLDFLVLGL